MHIEVVRLYANSLIFYEQFVNIQTVRLSANNRSCLRPSRPSLSVVLRRLADPVGEKNFLSVVLRCGLTFFLNFFIFLVMCFCYILY